MHKKTKIVLGSLVVLLILYMLLPTKIQNPVEGCGKESYNQKAFWHPWGDHMHNGIDIFAKKGTPVHPAIGGIVVATARDMKIGGNCILVLSSGFRLHYYAHLSEIDTHIGAFVTQKSVIGKVGDTGNAKGKPAHLHYSICSFFPQGDWRWESKQIAFYINPIKELEK
jgi:murein DD-endopeptidase MepM/ murein hydrolase activator NlpD